MPAAFVAALLTGVVVLAAWRPGGWSNELRAEIAIELFLGAALVVVIKGIFGLVSPRTRNIVRLVLLPLALLSLAAAIIIAWRLPGGLAHHWRIVLIVVAALLGLMIGSLAVGLLPDRERNWLRTWKGRGAVVTVAVPTGAAVYALVARDLPAWARLLLAGSALGLMLFARLWDQAAWPDVAVVGLATLAIGAAFIAPFKAKAQSDPSEAKVTFRIDAKKHDLTVLQRVDKNGDAILVLLDPVKTDDESALSYKSTRYEVTAARDLRVGAEPDLLRVTLKRGAADASASAFAADLQAATKIYVLQPAD